MAILDKDNIRSKRCVLLPHRLIASVDWCSPTCLVINATADSVPAATAWTLCKAVHFAQVSHHDRFAHSEWEALARRGSVDAYWTITASNQSR